MIIKIKRLNKAVVLPEYQTSGAAAIDLHAFIQHPVTVFSQARPQLIPTGLAMQIPSGYVGIIVPRSGLGHKKGLVLGHGTGIIDSDYRGEIYVSMWNRGKTNQMINPGDRFAQMLFIPVERVSITVVDELDETERGDGGLGSTGKGVPF